LKLDESNFGKKAELADKALAEIVGGVIAGMHLNGRCEYCPKVLDLLESLEHLSRHQWMLTSEDGMMARCNIVAFVPAKR